MAKNTFRERPAPPKRERNIRTDFTLPKINFSFFKDRRARIVFGLFLLFLSVFMFGAFLSYLLTGPGDQSIVKGLGKISLKDAGHQSENHLGILGAWLSHLFMYKWFGLSSFLVTGIVFIGGGRLLFGKAFGRSYPAVKTLVFFTVWICLVLGYFSYSQQSTLNLGLLGGIFGYETAEWFTGLTGWGYILILTLLFLAYTVYFIKPNISIPFFDKFYKSKTDVATQRSANTESVFSPTTSIDQDDETLTGLQTTETEEPTTESAPKEEEKKQPPQLELIIEETEEEEIIEAIPETETEMPMQPVGAMPATDNLENTTEAEQPDNFEPNLQEPYNPKADLSMYNYPKQSLLREHGLGQRIIDNDELQQNNSRIINTLNDYKIGIKNIRATVGPSVTLYEIIPEAGIRISKIKNLEDDIALSLAALGIRIIAPIPGKGTIGIEVPNKNRQIVSLRSVLLSEAFRNTDKELPIALGKTIKNELFIADLSKMPHLLIAGATGMGKSVGINVILTSLIYSKHPSELKFVMVDPKKVELALYNKIEKHFLAKLPDSEEAIITDTSKVIYTLNSLTIEMDNRYELLKAAGVRKLSEYNDKFKARRLNPMEGHRFLPYIVLVIDELADLMVTAGKEVETPIMRIAQAARAVGIHAILATQRPSVNVITGVIKANFPARIAYRVTSKVDSRTILDTGGADQLVDKGDMLLSLNNNITRLQCPFVDTQEVEEICNFVASQQSYSSAYELPEYTANEDVPGKSFDTTNRDPMFEEAARVLVMNQQGSTSLLQRKLKLGYNRAGRIVDQLEAARIVGPFEGSKAREVLIQDMATLEQLLSEINNNT